MFSYLPVPERLPGAAAVNEMLRDLQTGRADLNEAYSWVEEMQAEGFETLAFELARRLPSRR